MDPVSKNRSQEPFFKNFFAKYPQTPYVIAEIGVNHEGNFALAKKLIELAKEGGAHAAKFQTYKAEKIAAKQSPSYWDLSKEKTTSQFELFQKYDAFGETEYLALAEHCRRVGIDFLSTPFDLEAVDWLSPQMPFFKIASADLTNIPLLKKVAATGKSIVLSTGASRPGEIDDAVAFLRLSGCSEIILLHCILNYPCPDENANLDMILSLRKTFPELTIGYSDHTVPDPILTSLVVANIHGAMVLEKHFTHDKTLPGNDHYHAMDCSDLQGFWREHSKVLALRGTLSETKGKTALKDEALARRNARRSLVTLGPIRAGTVIRDEHLICKRPATGISPIHLETVLGTTVVNDLPDDHILQWHDLNGVRPDRVVGVIQARTGSTRFPGKMLKPLAGTPLIEWVIKRAQKAEKLSGLVLATSSDSKDDELAAVAQKLGIHVVRGNENDVALRFQTALKDYTAHAVLRICADNPFVDPTEIDRLIEEWQKFRPDYAYNHIPIDGQGYADGFGAELMSTRVLNEIVKYGSAIQKEHVTKYIWDNKESFTIHAVPAPAALSAPELRFDIDTPQDLARLDLLAAKVGLNGMASEFIKAAKNC